MKFVSLTRLIMAIILAVVIWGYVTFSQNPDRDVSFSNRDVRAIGISDKFTILNTELPKVDIKIRGSKDKIDPIQPSQVLPYVDLSKIDKAGSQSFKVQLDLPEGIRTTISPDSVEFLIDEYITKEFDLELVQRGVVGNQLKVDSITANVTKLKISGAKSLVDRVRRVVGVYEMGKFGLGSVEQEVFPTLYGNNEQLISSADLKLNPTNIIVRANVESQLNSKTVPVVIVQRGQPAPGFISGYVTKNPAIVTIISSDRSILEGTNAVDFVQTEPIDISGATAKIVTTTKLIPSGNYTVIEPLDVQVTIDIAPAQALLTVNVPLRVEGVGVNLIADISTDTIQIVLNGPAADLQRINLDQVEARLDLRGRDAGEFRLPVRITTPPGITVTNNPLVSVRLTRRATPTPLPTPTSTPSPTSTVTTTPPVVSNTPSPTVTSSPEPSATTTPVTPGTAQNVVSPRAETPAPTPTPTPSVALPSPPPNVTPQPSPTQR
jgi:hypothetical protein